MKENLSQLTMRQYIELVCGDTSVLKKGNEIVKPQRLAEVRNRIMYEFAEMSNEAGARALVSNHEKKNRAKSELLLFRVCNNLFAMQAFEECRQILIDYGIKNARSFDNKRLFDEIDRLMKRAGTESKRQHDEADKDDTPTSPSEVRKSYERQTASLMSYFKFQIDINTMPASQYACLIDQANKEIKAKINAMSRR